MNIIHVPAFHFSFIAGCVCWGATAMIISELKTFDILKNI
jgi:hypothetical protein